MRIVLEPAVSESGFIHSYTETGITYHLGRFNGLESILKIC
jgi:hypothetical protein